ncbi:MAG: PHP domain-containing protein [Planctomycetia bacterium]|nr:PHP domain-containing protein [Planctomycetia bacterium]
MSSARFVDLHTHSNVSDGVLSPSELVQRAAAAGLSAIALTDHDSVQGVTEAADQADKSGIEVVPGVEIGADFTNGALHILGYFLDVNNEHLRERLGWLCTTREERNQEMVDKLNSLGLEITLDDVKGTNPSIVITRAHFAAALIKKGYVTEWQEAFDRYLGRDGAAYVGRDHFTAVEAMDLIHSAGGLTSLAHPKQLNRPMEEVSTIVAEYAEGGLDAIEVDSSDHDLELKRAYVEIAQRHGLLMTGGSDYHGIDTRGLRIGKGSGDRLMPYEYLEAMKQHLSSRGA